MKNINVKDHRRIKLEDIEKPDYIPFKTGRPKREKIIGKDDILNLSIELNRGISFEEFLKIT